MPVANRLHGWKRQLVRGAGNADLGWKIVRALDELLGNDRHLLEVNANERAITHRLGAYLAVQFPSWHVDCEYNREGHEVKTLSGQVVVPDVIVHRRGTEENLLVIEVKKTTSSEPDEGDKEKLRAFRGELGYENALFLKLACGLGRAGVEEVEWIQNPSDAQPFL
jgi:hypothetical protein